MTKYALVDGSLGHTGSFLVKELLAKGDYKIVATDLKSEDREIIMTKEKVFSTGFEYMDCREWDGVTYIAADLTKKESLKELFSEEIFKGEAKNYDIIFHPASLYDYGAPYELLHRVNYNGLKNLLDVIFEHSKNTNTPVPRFIHWSTCGVYGEPEYQTDEKGYIYPIDETAPFNPPNNYSQTKVEQEKLIFQIAEKKNDFKYTIIRSAPIYGPYQTYGMYHIYYAAYIAGHSLIPLVYPKKKKLMMPMIHVKDLVKAAVFVAEQEDAVNQIYNIVNDTPLQEQWLEFIYSELGINYMFFPAPWFLYSAISNFAYEVAKRKKEKAHKYAIRPRFDLPMVGYLTHQYYFSNQKIKDLGFKFEYNDWEKGSSETIQWYRTHGWFPPVTSNVPGWVNLESKPAVEPEEEYKTPMEGGEIF